MQYTFDRISRPRSIALTEFRVYDGSYDRLPAMESKYRFRGAATEYLVEGVLPS